MARLSFPPISKDPQKLEISRKFPRLRLRFRPELGFKSLEISPFAPPNLLERSPNPKSLHLLITFVSKSCESPNKSPDRNNTKKLQLRAHGARSNRMYLLCFWFLMLFFFWIFSCEFVSILWSLVRLNEGELEKFLFFTGFLEL